MPLPYEKLEKITDAEDVQTCQANHPDQTTTFILQATATYRICQTDLPSLKFKLKTNTYLRLPYIYENSIMKPEFFKRY